MQRLSILGLCLSGTILLGACGDDGSGGPLATGGAAGQAGKGGSAGSAGGGKATSGGTGGDSMIQGGAAGEAGTSSGGSATGGEGGATGGEGGATGGEGGATGGEGGLGESGSAGSAGSGNGGSSQGGSAGSSTGGSAGDAQGGSAGTAGTAGGGSGGSDQGGSAGIAGDGGSDHGGNAGTGTGGTGQGCSLTDRSCSQGTLHYCPAGAPLTLECLSGCSPDPSAACNPIEVGGFTLPADLAPGELDLYGFSVSEAGQALIFDVMPTSHLDTRILICAADGTACSPDTAIADSATPDQMDGFQGELDRVDFIFQNPGDYIVGVMAWLDTGAGPYELSAVAVPPPLPVVFSEGFDVWPPAEWDVAIDSGNGGWDGCDPDGFCYRDVPVNFSVATGAYAAADSDHFGLEPMDTSLTTPTIDLTGYTAAELIFASYYLSYDSDFGEVQASADGSTFTTLLTIDIESVPGDVRVDLSAYAGAPVVLRFHYVGNFDYYWLIDDVRVGAE